MSLESDFANTNFELSKLDDLDCKNINETVPRYVSLVNMISDPFDDDADLAPALATNVSAKKIIGFLQDFNHICHHLDEFISYFYQQRSITQGIDSYLENNEANEKDEARNAKIASIAKSILERVVETIKDLLKLKDDAIQCITAIFTDEELWNKGQYTDELIDAIFKTLFKMEAIFRLIPTKKMINTDITTLIKFAQITSENDIISMALRVWINTPTSFRNEFINSLLNSQNSPSYELLNKILGILYTRINNLLNEHHFILAENETMYIVALTIFLELNYKALDKEKSEKENDKKAKYFIQNIPIYILDLLGSIREKHQLIILIYDFAILFDDIISPIIKRIPGLPEQVKYELNLKDIAENLRNIFENLSTDISSLSLGITDATTNYYMEKIPVFLNETSSAIQIIRELIAGILNTEVKDENSSNVQFSQYEKAIYSNFTEEQRELTMQILSLCRSIRELIYSKLDKLCNLIDSSIQENIQDFVKNKLELSLNKYIKNQKFNKTDMELIRAYIGHFQTDEEMAVRQEKKEILSQPHETKNDPESFYNLR